MNIKMKVEKSKNIKNKIGLKNFFISKNKAPFKPKTINIQTINVLKNSDYFNEDKNIYTTKNINNIRYLNNINNYKIIPKNDYFINKQRNYFFNSFDSERFPSPINSVGSSSYIPSGKKKFKKRYHRKNLFQKNKNKFQNNSINNLSFNTNNTNNNNNINISYINSSSSSSYLDDNNNNYSDISENSYKSRENKRKKYFEKMMVEDNELDYLKRSEVGLIPTDDEDNNNSIDNSISIEENFNNEIERILIEIYNKNISLISSLGNSYEINKNYSDIEDIEKQIKKYLKKENLKTNLLVLKSLGNKIKELVGKYKEKIFEIEELKNIQRQLILNEQFIRCNNSLESNVATTNSNSNSYYDEDNLFWKNNLTLNPNEERNEKGISYILLRELINIKRTLKISSKEIEGIFKYPLNILKDENGKKKKFSIELMQREEFCRIILNDEIIFNLLNQIKEIFSKNKYSEINKWLIELDENYEHKNEMTKFIEYINDNLLLQNNNNNKNIIENNDEQYINNNKSNINNEEIKKKDKDKENTSKTLNAKKKTQKINNTNNKTIPQNNNKTINNSNNISSQNKSINTENSSPNNTISNANTISNNTISNSNTISNNTISNTNTISNNNNISINNNNNKNIIENNENKIQDENNKTSENNNLKLNTIENSSKVNNIQNDFNMNLIMNENLSRTRSTGALFPKFLTPISCMNAKLPEKFFEMYKKSFNDPELITELVNEKMKTKKKEEENLFDIDDSHSIINEKRAFDSLEIDDNYSFDIISRNDLSTKEKRLYEKLEKMLVRVQQRKNILITRKSRFNENVDKIGIMKNRKYEIN